MSIACPPETVIRSFVTTDAGGPEQERLVEHFSNCPACQAVLDRCAPLVDEERVRRAGGLTAGQSSELMRGVRGALGDGGSLAGGRFRFRRALGAGGMGEVFEAEDTRLGRRVAIKTIRGERFSGDALKRLETEARVLAELSHPGIVRVHEWGEHRGLPFLAMEYVDGETLSARLKRGPLAPADAAALARLLAQALEHVHARGLLHRDLKPSNIVLEPAGENAGDGAVRDSLEGKSWKPRLIDFGLTKRLEGAEELSRAGGLVGTPAYMAPEQAEGRVDVVGPRSDLYGLGAVLYHCLTGQPPFPPATDANTLQMIRHVEPPNPRLFNRGVSRDLETVCLKCLRKEPAGRYHTAGELADDLGRFLAGQPIVARPVGRVEKLWRWAGRNRKLAMALGALLVVLTLLPVVLGVYAWREARLLGLAEAETARANRQLRETVRVFVRNANEMAGVANSLPGLRAGQADPEAVKLQRKLMASYRQQMDAFGADPELGGRFPEDWAEMVYFYARMCEDAGERGEALQADRRLLGILAGVAEPGDESLKRELTAALPVGMDLVFKKQAGQAVELLGGVWERRRGLPEERLRANPEVWRFLENLAHLLSGVMANELKDTDGAGRVQRELGELRAKVEQQAGG